LIFPVPQYRVKPGVLIPSITDIDLLVFDDVSRSVLVIQHKWLIAPDTLRASISNDEKLSSGVSQAVKSRDYLRSDHSFLQDKLGLSARDRIGGIDAVVVYRGLEGTGFLGPSTVTIVTEVAFRELVSRSDSLETLWRLLNLRPDQQEAKKNLQKLDPG